MAAARLQLVEDCNCQAEWQILILLNGFHFLVISLPHFYFYLGRAVD